MEIVEDDREQPAVRTHKKAPKREGNQAHRQPRQMSSEPPWRSSQAGSTARLDPELRDQQAQIGRARNRAAEDGMLVVFQVSGAAQALRRRGQPGSDQPGPGTESSGTRAGDPFQNGRSGQEDKSPLLNNRAAKNKSGRRPVEVQT